jgi:threonine aldolase
MTGRLADDHANARRLAEGIARIPGLRTDPHRVRTNIVYCTLVDQRFDDATFLTRLTKRGVLVSHTDPARFRLLTHYGIGPAEIDAALEALEGVLRS